MHVDLAAIRLPFPGGNCHTERYFVLPDVNLVTRVANLTVLWFFMYLAFSICKASFYGVEWKAQFAEWGEALKGKVIKRLAPLGQIFGRGTAYRRRQAFVRGGTCKSLRGSKLRHQLLRSRFCCW